MKWNAPSLIELTGKPAKAAKQPAAKHQVAKSAVLQNHKKQRSKSHSGGDSKRRKIEPESVQNHQQSEPPTPTAASTNHPPVVCSTFCRREGVPQKAEASSQESASLTTVDGERGMTVNDFVFLAWLRRQDM